MRSLIGLCYLFLCLSVTSGAQQVSWVVTSGGALSQSSTQCVSFADGSILNGGFFQGQTNFYPGDNTPRISRGGRDIFVQKLDTNGNTQWVVTFGGKGEEMLRGMAIDGDGNILLVGTFEDTCDFDPGSGIDIGVAKGQTDMFLLKLDSSGTYMWSRRFGGSSYDAIYGLAIDPYGDIYIGGNFTYTVDFSTDSIPYLQNSFGTNSGFVMKLNTHGEGLWFKKYGDGENAAIVYRMAVTNTKLWIWGGHSSDSLNFGTVFNPLWVYSYGPGQSFLLQIDLHGNATQVATFDGVVRCEDLTTDINDNVLITGWINGNADLDPGSGNYPVVVTSYGDIFIIKLDSNADFLWARTFTSNMGALCAGTKISSFEQGDVLLLANFQGTVDFDPGPSVVTKTTNGQYDVAILRLNAAGEFVWLHTFGGSSFDGGNSLCIDATKFYVSGSFSSTVDFNPGGPPYLLTANGGDAYLIKFGNYSALSTPAYEILPPKIYPNPTSGILQFDGAFEHAQLLNLQGQLVYQHANLNEENRLDLSLLNEGVYLLKLIKQGRVSHHKVVVQR